MSIFNRKKITDFLIYGFGQVINLVSPLFVMPFIIFKCGEDGLGNRSRPRGPNEDALQHGLTRNVCKDLARQTR